MNDALPSDELLSGRQRDGRAQVRLESVEFLQRFALVFIVIVVAVAIAIVLAGRFRNGAIQV